MLTTRGSVSDCEGAAQEATPLLAEGMEVFLMLTMLAAPRGKEASVFYFCCFLFFIWKVTKNNCSVFTAKVQSIFLHCYTSVRL